MTDMTDLTGRRYWLVGASEGLGRALAVEMSRAGAHLVLSARSADKLADLVAELPGPAEAVVCDISNTASVTEAAARVHAGGPLDGCVFLAGVYWPMKAQDWDFDKALAMADINFTGAFRVIGAVVPGMVERGQGHIVLTGSLSGFRGLAGAIGYSASKAGVMALAESMQADLRTSNIRVQLINPGFIRTRLTDKNDFAMPFIMDPDEAARIFIRHMQRGGFKRSFPTLFSWVFRLSQFLPDWAYYRVFGSKG